MMNVFQTVSGRSRGKMVEQYGAESLFQVRRQHIAQVLEAMGGNMDATANVLG